ncbi:MAG: hypothetical protein WA857_20470 [Candidatus Acidiferrum sp.]
MTEEKQAEATKWERRTEREIEIAASGSVQRKMAAAPPRNLQGWPGRSAPLFR